MKYLLRLFFLCIGYLPYNGIAQNIIRNGAFQDTFSFSPTRPIIWRSPTNTTPDFYNANQPDPNWQSPQNAVGYQTPKNGDWYSGFFIFTKTRQNGREYLQGELNRSLTKDSTYCFQMYMSLADSSNYAVKNNMGVHFSSYKIDSNQIRTVLHLNPQIEFNDTVYFLEKKNWIKLSASFISGGGEQYLTLGNFQPDSVLDTARIQGGKQFWMDVVYYYIDDLWLSHCDSLPDTSIGIWEQQAKHQLKLYPNPSNGLLNLESEVLVAQVKMYDVQGRLLQIIKQPAKQIELPEAKGIYLLRLELENGEVVSRKVVKN